MRVRVITLSLALVIGVHAMGCKSAPKLPWFKTADATPAGASAATTASTAPQLPSEVARQAEALGASTPAVNIATAPTATTASSAATTAPAYSAKTMPSAYPSTGAQDYLSNSAAALKSAASSSLASAATTAKSGLPYDPTAVPPGNNVAAGAQAGSNSPTQADRYGLASQDRYANAYPTTAPTSYPSAAQAASVTNTQAASPGVPSVPFASNPESASLGDRYATQSTPTAGQVSTTVPSYAAPVQTASAVDTLQPYRPGGTSTYPGTSANYEVATRPGTTSTSTTTGGTLYR